MELAMQTRRGIVAGLAAAGLGWGLGGGTGRFPAALAATASPLGLWEAKDEKSGKPRALLWVSDQGGVLSARVEKLLFASDAGKHCNYCAGDRAGKLVLGLEVLRGMRPDGAAWDGGTIIDPSTGSVYRCRMRMSADGRELHLRGFIGIALIGRSQTWYRPPT